MGDLSVQIKKEHLLSRHHSGYANSCWDLIHRFALAPDISGQGFKQFLFDIGKSYACPLCAAVWLGILEFMPWDLVIADQFHRFVFSVELHNLFNLELNRLAITVPEAIEMHGAPCDVNLARTWDTTADSVQQLLAAMVDGVRAHSAAQTASEWQPHGFHYGRASEPSAAESPFATARPSESPLDSDRNFACEIPSNSQVGQVSFI